MAVLDLVHSVLEFVSYFVLRDSNFISLPGDPGGGFDFTPASGSERKTEYLIKRVNS